MDNSVSVQKTWTKAKFLKYDRIYDEIYEFPWLASHAQNSFCKDLFSFLFHIRKSVFSGKIGLLRLCMPHL